MEKTRERLRRLRQAFRVFRSPPRGLNCCSDISRLLTPRTIFDVGANKGQSAAEYVDWFPQAAIYCFEPSAINAAGISKRFGGQVSVVEAALGSQSGVARLSTDARSTMFHLADDGEEQVRVDTVDEFCRIAGSPISIS